MQEELEEAKDKARRRSIGNIKFIGELFKLKMLTEAIMHDCVVKLLKNHDEESLECLCRLLTTIGKDLDFEKAKVRRRRTLIYYYTILYLFFVGFMFFCDLNIFIGSFRGVGIWTFWQSQANHLSLFPVFMLNLS